MGIYGESERIILPSDIEIDPNRATTDIDQVTGKLSFNPLKDIESTSIFSPTVQIVVLENK